jgi:hypothetical protein
MEPPTNGAGVNRSSYFSFFLAGSDYFRWPLKPTKILDVFSSAIKVDENTLRIFVGHLGRRKREHIFVGCFGRRKYRYFRRLPTKIILFSSTLFRRPIFVGGPTKIAIFVGFWPTKIAFFPVVMAQPKGFVMKGKEN